LPVAHGVTPGDSQQNGGVVLTIIENESNVWMVITVDGELRLYTRADAGEWGELSVGDDSDQVDPEKSFMLEELYARQSGQEEEDEEGGPEDEAEELDEEEEEPDESEPDLDEDEESEVSEDEEPEEEEKPRRRRAATARSGRSTAGRK
jgi:hypothetical protein